MWNRCSNRRKCLFGILAIVLIAAIIIGIIFLYRTQPLIELCPGTGSPSYRVAGYCDAFISDGTVIEGMISDAQITELLTLASVERGVSYRAMPSPCFELRMSYPDGNFYIIVIGSIKILKDSFYVELCCAVGICCFAFGHIFFKRRNVFTAVNRCG